MFYKMSSVGSGSQSLDVEDDGLKCPEVGAWAETKYRLLALYDELFSTGMEKEMGSAGVHRLVRWRGI